MTDTDDLFDLYQVDNQGSESFTEYIIGMMNNYVEELKRLREQFKLAYDWVDTQFPDGGMADFAEYIGDEEE